MAKATQLPSGSWRVKVSVKTPDGKYTVKSFTADKKKDAEYMALKFEQTGKKKSKDFTLGEAVDKYITSKSNILSPTTIQGYKGIRKNYFNNIYDIPLKNINSQIIQEEINTLALSLSSKTVANAHGLISAALSVYAPEINLRISLPKKKKIIREIPAIEQIVNIVKGTEIELPCMLALWLSLRMSEIRGLRKSDCRNGKIIVQNSIVTVNGQRVEKSETKTYNSTRICDMPPYIQNLIDQVENEYITELSGQAIYKRFSRLLAKNNIPHIRFHDLRHMNASVMLALNIPDKYAMERGGWSSDNVLKSVYQHTISSEREEVDKKINDYFESIVDK